MTKPSLKTQVAEFRKTKKRLIPALIGLGVVGLGLPILPGVALLVLAFSLAMPGQAERALRKIRSLLFRGDHV